MFGLALRTLRARKGAAIGAFLALFCAGVLVSACGALLETGLSGVIAPERYAGAPVIVAADQDVHFITTKEKKDGTKTKDKAKPLSERAWIAADLGGRLRSVPGVQDVVGDLVFPASVVTRNGQPLTGPDGKASIGHGWESAAMTPYTLREGTEPRQSDEVVLDAELAARSGYRVGDKVVVQATQAPATYRMVGIATPASPVTQESAVFFAGGEARRLAGHDGLVAAFGVLTQPNANVEQVRGAIAGALNGTGAIVSTGDERGDVEFVDAANSQTKLTSMGGAIGGTSLIVAILVVVGTFALSIQQRHREIAMLRAVGATPRQVRRMIGGEALVLGLIGGGLGAIVGVPVASWLRDTFVSYGAISDALELVRSPFPILAAIVATMAAAWVAARVTARRTARIRPTEALGEARIERSAIGAGRGLAGLVFAGLAVVITFVLSLLHSEAAATPVTYIAVLLWIVTVALLGPLIVRVSVTVIGGILRMFPISGFLAAENARAYGRRLALVVTPLSLLIGMTATVLFLPTTLSSAAQSQTKEGLRADYVLTANGPGVPTAAADAVRKLPGTTVTEVLHTSVRLDTEKLQVQAVTPDRITQMLDVGVTSGSLDQLNPGTVALSELRAGDFKLGNEVEITLGDGVKTKLKLVAIYDRNLGFGDAVMARQDVVGHVDNPLDKAVLVKGAVDINQIREQTRAFPGVGVLDRSGYDALQADQEQANAEINFVFMCLIIAFTSIAVVNTLAMAVGDRRREFALLRLVGTTRRQVLRMLRLEVSMVVLVAVVLGTVAALLTLTGFSAGMTGSASPSVDPVVYGLILLGAIVLAVLATVLPARMTLRNNAADEINSRE